MAEYPQIEGIEITASLGEGGMATVYRGVQTRLGREVAIKVMEPLLLKDPSFAARFEKEARTSASLIHPGIVTIHDIGFSDKVPYIVMEYLPGGSLAGLIAQGPVEPGKALETFAAIASALDYAHGEGFIHRDVKPDNILFRKDGTPVLCDFGIARAVGSATRLTKTGMSVGTPHYMSPEQARGKKLDGRSDLYSLGVVLYEMLTGKVPFEAEDSVAVAIAHVQDPVPRLPENLQKYQPLLDKLLAKDPDQRPQTGKAAADLAKNLPVKEKSRDAGGVLETVWVESAILQHPLHQSRYTLGGGERFSGISPSRPTFRKSLKQSDWESQRLKSSWLLPLIICVLVVAVVLGYFLISQAKEAKLEAQKVQVPVEERMAEMQKKLDQEFQEKLKAIEDKMDTTEEKQKEKEAKLQRLKDEREKQRQAELEKIRKEKEVQGARIKEAEEQNQEEDHPKQEEQAKIDAGAEKKRQAEEAARKLEGLINAKIAAGEPIEMKYVTTPPQKIGGKDPMDSHELRKLFKDRAVTVISEILVNEQDRVSRVRFKGNVEAEAKLELSQILATWSFYPARRSNTPVKVWFEVPLRFIFYE